MKSFLSFVGLVAFSGALAAAEGGKHCLDGVCIGDDLVKLSVKWTPAAVGGDARQYYANELKSKKPQDIYKAANHKLVGEPKVLATLLPYVLDAQAFDGEAIEQLKQVQAFCTNLTLKGQLALDTKEKVFVTAQAVPPTADGMQLRIVRIEKIFDAYHPISRPEQEGTVKNLTKSLKKQYPGLVEVRDIDDMFLNDKYTDKAAILGFKFSNDVAFPMALKLRDVSDVPALDDTSVASVCKI
jgi:hypothetical protein